MMTPEERAAKVLLDPMGALVPGQSFDFIAERIAAAIRAAIAEEREYIEQAILTVRADYPDDVFPGGVGQFARTIIDRIVRLVNLTLVEGDGE